MGMTVITLSNVPVSLRGDLTKWMQEIATGVYVGSLSSRVREELWERVTQSVGSGQATLSYATNTELGYQFVTHRTKQINVSFDGIPLVMAPREGSPLAAGLRTGFSHQASFRSARKHAGRRKEVPTGDANASCTYIVLDIETDGLDPLEDNVIEMAAIRVVSGKAEEEFHCLVRSEDVLPAKIVELTGITDEMLADEGRDIPEALLSLVDFIGDLPIVGYNVSFDVEFINEKLRDINQRTLKNNRIDLMALVKKEKMFLKSFKLKDALAAYGIDEQVPHRALEDARLTCALSTKVNGFALMLDRRSR